MIRCIVCGGEGYHKPLCSAKHFQGIVTASNAMGPAGIFVKEIPDPEKEIEKLEEQRIQKTKVFIVFDNVTGNIMWLYFNREKATTLCNEMREDRKNYLNENYVVLEREVK